MTETVEQFVARGGEIEHLPRGLCNWDALTDRKKINPTIPETERKAAKAAKEALPTPRKPERPPPPKEPKPRQKPGPKPGTKTGPRLTKEAREVMRLLKTHPTIPDLAPVLGTSRNTVWLLLDRLRRKGWVESNGKARVLTRWKVTADAPVR